MMDETGYSFVLLRSKPRIISKLPKQRIIIFFFVFKKKITRDDYYSEPYNNWVNELFLIILFYFKLWSVKYTLLDGR